jgi:hypothetical protein
MIVMGGIIGSGIFMNPSVVALQVHTPFLILGAWILGGLFALTAAFIWAELAALRPEVGGQYAYLREAFHPGVAFVYGWVLLLVVQTRRYGGGRRYIRALLRRTDTPARLVRSAGGDRAGDTDDHQLSWRPSRQHSAKHSDGVEDYRDCDVSRVRVCICKSKRESYARVG